MVDGVLFTEPTHVGVLRRMRLIRGEDRSAVVRRAVLMIGIAWVPLAVFCVVLGQTHSGSILRGFIGDVATHVRLLLALPLFVAAEYIILPPLERITLHFRHSRLLPPERHAEFEQAVERARQRSAGAWPSFFVAALSYATVVATFAFAHSETLATWQRLPESHAMSIAGWWHLLVSLPLLIGLIYAWIWRLVVWCRFLLSVARLDLRLVASHPDHVAGLQFVARSPAAFIPLALAVGLIVSGTLANRVLYQGLNPNDAAMTPIVTAMVMVAILMIPPLMLGRALFATKNVGVVRYGELASRLGIEFEHKWLDARSGVDRSSLSEPDFSATTDLYGVSSNVYAMHILPIDYRVAIPIAVATLLPFVPIWLSEVPLTTIIHALLGLHA